MTVVPLTTLSGDEYSPAFSPDGEQIAFSWNGEHEDNFDVYIKSVDSAAVRRLTSDAGFEGNPSWSPDGKQIAFVRDQAGVRRVYVTSSIGGTELKLGEFAISDADAARYSSIAWSPDPDFVAAAGVPPASPSREAVRGIYLLPVGRGVPRLLVPAPGGHGALQSCLLARRPPYGVRVMQGIPLVRRLRRRFRFDSRSDGSATAADAANQCPHRPGRMEP